jgi:hypothetical protein
VLSPNLQVTAGNVTIVDTPDLPSPMALVVRAVGETSALVTNPSFLSPVVLTGSVCTMPAGMVWFSLVELMAQATFINDSPAYARFDLDANVQAQVAGVTLKEYSMTLSNNRQARHYVYSSSESFDISVYTYGPSQCIFKILQFAPAKATIPAGGGDTVSDHVGQNDLFKYAPYFLSIQSFFGDCAFNPECFWKDLNEYYVLSLKDDGSNPDTVPLEYAQLITYAGTTNMHTGALHPFSPSQLKSLYAFLYSLMVMETQLSFANVVDVRRVARLQDADQQTFNTSPVFNL